MISTLIYYIIKIKHSNLNMKQHKIKFNTLYKILPVPYICTHLDIIQVLQSS